MTTKTMNHSMPLKKQAPGGFAAVLTAGLLAMPAAHAATITQTVTNIGWNDAVWGPGPSAPTNGNDYLMASGLAAGGATSVGTPDVTSRVRLLSGQGTFGGDSITVVAGSEILGKDAGTYTANVVLNGGLIRWSPNTGGVNGTLAGTINVAADSVIGAVQGGTNAFTIASTLSGSSTLRLAAGTGNLQTITFDDGLGTSLNGFAGILDIGGGNNLVTVDFNQAYIMGLAGMTMGDYSTADRLNLDANISLASFSFAGNPLAIGTYTTTELNSQFGSGTQFTGSGTLTVIPEPSIALLGGLGLFGLLRRRRV